MKQDATAAQPHAGNFAGRAPVEQRAAADWQPCQQLLLVNEVRLTRWRLFWFAIHGRIFSDYRSRIVLNGYKMNFPLFPARTIFAPTFLMAAFSHRTEPALLVYQTK